MILRPYQKEAIQAQGKFQGGNPVIELPTGSGKTVVLGGIVQQTRGGVLVLSHVKEILEQNHRTLSRMLNNPVGLYSAGLNVRHIEEVTVASIQSVYRQPELFSHVEEVLIDECHLISGKGMYHELLKKLDRRCTGLTASPYRMFGGLIYGQEDSFFKDLCYKADIPTLQKQGYLAEIKIEGAKEKLDTAGVKTTGGDFSISDMSLKYDRATVTRNIISQLSPYKDKYKHWLLFAIDIAHAENVAEALNQSGIRAAAVHSKSPRDQAIQDFKAGKLQALVNVQILTTGFDYPEIDFIVVLRPTKSPVLHVQMVGRGLRTAIGKKHCLIKDFAGNFARLGPIEDVQVGERIKRGKGGNNPFMKECPDCLAIVHPSVRVCVCGHTFKFKHNLSTKSFSADKVKWYDITRIFANIHRKSGKPDSVKISYVCGARVFSEWILIQHPGYAGHKARYWSNTHWKGEGAYPRTAKEIVENFQHFTKPGKIKVNENGKYPSIIQTN